MNNNNIYDMPYAEWLEQTLRDISVLPVKGITLMGVLDGGEIYTNYYNISIADKLLISGTVSQDATLDMLAAQGIIKYDDEEDDEEDDEYDEDGEVE